MSNKIERPSKEPGTRLCITVTRDGVTAYGNKAAFESVAAQLLWLASSKPSDHYECHTVMSLLDDASMFDNKRPGNVCVLFDKVIKAAFAKANPDDFGFELTFMMAGDTDLNRMDGLQEEGLLPDNWNSE